MNDTYNTYVVWYVDPIHGNWKCFNLGETLEDYQEFVHNLKTMGIMDNEIWCYKNEERIDIDKFMEDSKYKRKVYVVVIEDWDYNDDFRELKSIEKIFSNIDDARDYCDKQMENRQKKNNHRITSTYDIEEYDIEQCKENDMPSKIYLVWYYKTMGDTSNKLDLIFYDKDKAIKYRDQMQSISNMESDNNCEWNERTYFITTNNVW